MRKMTDFIVNKRHFILCLFILFTVVSQILSTKVKINYDIAKYLPNTSETRIGMNIMEKEWKETSTLNLMFENLSEEEKFKIKEELSAIDGVKSVDYENTEEYNKENDTLYVMTLDTKSDSKTAANVYDEIAEKYQDYTFYTSGNVSECNKTVLSFWIIVLAVICALIILLVMCESYVEPFLFLISILMAVVLNKGTNIIFSSVSNITNSIAAILQMALSMDYSIMLMNRYDQEKQKEKNQVKAMKNALYKSFTAISSSSITTIVGLLALIFMSFQIGKDLGFVLAKGVLFSLLCIFFVLPALILMFDKWIVKTKKKSPIVSLNKLGKFSYRMRFIAIFLFLIIFLTSFNLKGNLGIDYTDSQTDEISKVFEENNQIAIIYPKEEEEKISKYLKEFEKEEKIEEVLGYGNTINEKLTYDQLNKKLNDLGADITVEDDLLKILYYDYYHPEKDNKMTFESFIRFIEEEAYYNEKASKKIDDKMKQDITRLKNFVTIDSIHQKRTASEIANILQIEKSKIDDIFVYYLSKKENIQISIPDFINFLNHDLLTNEKYAGKINQDLKNKLNTLSKLMDEKTIQTKLKSEQMAEIFGIDKNTMNEFYQYYILSNEISTKMTISEFSNFVLNDVLTNSNYASSLEEESIQNIKLLTTFSNLDLINKQMTSQELGNLFGISENQINQILLCKYSSLNEESKFSITDFLNKTIEIADSTDYLKGIDLTNLRKLSLFSKNENSRNTTKMEKADLSSLFASLKEGLVEEIYFIKGFSEEEKMSPQEFVNLTIEIFAQNENPEANQTLNQLKLLKLIIDDSVSEDKIQYSARELSQILNIDLQQMYQIYSLIDYLEGNSSNWTMTPNEFVNVVLAKKEVESIQNSLNESTIQQLELLSMIMTSSINNQTFSYQELSQIIGIPDESVKQIYALYISSQNNTSITPKELVDFLLSHQSDNMLASKISDNTIQDFKLLQFLMDGVLSHKKYNKEELSSFLSINQEDMTLLYGLYNSKYIHPNFQISFKDFIDFLLQDVVTNQDYANQFDTEQVSKLNTVNKIMNAAINQDEYTKNEMYSILHKLSNQVEKNTIDMLYTYYGSNQQYQNDWKMTIEEFITYLNETILNDERFQDFLEEDMRSDIREAKTTIEDAKELLIGDSYSRVIFNTTLDMESPETFEWIQNTKETLAQELDEFYVIGDSPMAYEMSKTFHNELDFMTVITMIAIFVVVAITFKSILIPIILVLTIQTAVYLTMGILSVVGENVYFISILIVQSILMGATIDYAILYTSYYLEYRKKEEIKQSIIDAYNHSIHTILTSSLILMIVTLIVGSFTSAIASKICKTISEGTLCSTMLILLLLPAVLAGCDKLITKKKKNFQA